MSKWLFKGTPRQIGRFGHLEKGDVVEMTEEEEKYLKENPHKEFDPLSPDQAAKAEKAAADRRAEAEKKAAQENQAKQQAALAANAPAQPESDGLDDLAPTELLNVIDALNEEGAGIKVTSKTKRAELIALIRNARQEKSQAELAKAAREEDEASGAD